VDPAVDLSGPAASPVWDIQGPEVPDHLGLVLPVIDHRAAEKSCRGLIDVGVDNHHELIGVTILDLLSAQLLGHQCLQEHSIAESPSVISVVQEPFPEANL